MTTSVLSSHMPKGFLLQNNLMGMTFVVCSNSSRTRFEFCVFAGTPKMSWHIYYWKSNASLPAILCNSLIKNIAVKIICRFIYSLINSKIEIHFFNNVHLKNNVLNNYYMQHIGSIWYFALQKRAFLYLQYDLKRQNTRQI